jgi:hypothetical protein
VQLAADLMCCATGIVSPLAPLGVPAVLMLEVSPQLPSGTMTPTTHLLVDGDMMAQSDEFHLHGEVRPKAAGKIA